MSQWVSPLRRSGRGSYVLTLVAAATAFALAYLLAFLLRFEFRPEQKFVDYIAQTTALVVLIKLATFHFSGVFRILWAYLGLADLFRILRATALASALLATSSLLTYPRFELLIPRSVLFLDGVLTFLAIAGFFAAMRWARELETGRMTRGLALEPVFIVGAGDAGEGLLREIQRNLAVGVQVVGFLDDDSRKLGRALRGVPVVGQVARAQECAIRRGVRKAYVAIPSASGSVIRRIVTQLLDAGLAIKILPPMRALSASSGFVPQLREVAIEDLLRREAVKLDNAAISRFLTGKVVLVSGAAGSIGSELCRQILDYHPARLVALDRAETPLHELMLELATRARTNDLRPELADIVDGPRIGELFASHRPQVVFHAAALKHVPLLEAHPREAVRVNVEGTRVLAEAARELGAQAFVMISTDKAVNPSSVMGATKRVAELLVRSFNGAGRGTTRYVSVRFGNVLGSNGSVLPIFRRQLASGGPLTVTHPDMKRYFMTIPEAVQLVMQAAVLGSGGEVFLLDMGEPMKIVDLAEDLIRLSGLVPGKDVQVEFTGIRPGEKLFEELHMPSEALRPTAHPQLFSIHSDGGIDVGALGRFLDAVDCETSREGIVGRIRELLGDYEGQALSLARAGDQAS